VCTIYINCIKDELILQLVLVSFSLIHLFSWSGLIDTNMLLGDIFKVPSLKTGKMEPLFTALTDEQEEQFRNMLNRLQTIFQVN